MTDRSSRTGPGSGAPWLASLASGVTAFETDAGLVLADTGQRHLARALSRRRGRPRRPAVRLSPVQRRWYQFHALAKALAEVHASLARASAASTPSAAQRPAAAIRGGAGPNARASPLT